MEINKEMSDRRPHILAIPYPLMGHMTPIVQLCKILVAQAGCRVTIACSDKLVAGLCRLLSEKYDDHGESSIKILPIWDGLPAEEGADVRNWDVHRKQLHAFHEGLPRSFAAHFDNFRSTNVVCVLSDLYLSWTQDVADRLGVPRLAFWVSAPAEFQVYFHAKELLKTGNLPFKAPHGRENDVDNMMCGMPGRAPVFHRTDGRTEGEEKITINGLPTLRRKDFPTFLQIEDVSDELFFMFVEHVKTASQASMLLFNTFEALEGKLLDLLRSQGIPAHPIGALFMLEDAIIKKQVHQEVHGVQDGEQYQECLQWIDKQNPNSIIYIAFGTFVSLPMAQVKELGWGLLNSGQAFIWVYPKQKSEDEEEKEEFLKGFMKQAQGKGLVLEWAPQKWILRHRATGGFLSHCGWNSTLEAICYGVPMLCLPFLSDQCLHCKLVVEEWKVGMELKRSGKEALALAHDTSRLIKELLMGQQGIQLRKRAQELKQAAHNSIELDASSSHATLDAITKLLKSS